MTNGGSPLRPGLPPTVAGTGGGMRPMTHRHLRSLPHIDLTEGHAVVETEEHEIIDFEGCSEAEVEAKVKDFYAWAS